MRIPSALLSLLLAASVVPAAIMGASAPSQAASEVPPASLKIPPMVPEKSVSTYIRSEAAPGGGIAVNVIYPQKPRYGEGAPVVVVVPGGESASGLDFSTHTAQSGFVEVRFAFPGGGIKQFSSSGVYDYRGPASQLALVDVLKFAAGKSTDIQGKTIAQLVPAKVANQNLGVIGWSNGGNTLAVTLAKHAKEVPFVSWLVFYETPLGSLFYPPALGGAQDLLQNRHYRQGSGATGRCLVDFRKLAYSEKGQKSPGSHRKIGQPEIPGVVFFDENGDKEWQEPFEFAFPYSCDVGVYKQIYPPAVTSALTSLFKPAEWPRHVATLEESQAFFAERDGSQYIRTVAKAYPKMLVTVFGSRLDHLQRQPDHPHITLNYNNWLENKVAFVRLNPDPVYVSQVSAMNPANFSSNKANSSIDAETMDQHLEPEGLIPDYAYVQAAAAELADRKRAGNLNDSLTVPLIVYSNGAVADTAGSAGDKSQPAKQAGGGAAPKGAGAKPSGSKSK